MTDIITIQLQKHYGPSIAKLEVLNNVYKLTLNQNEVLEVGESLDFVHCKCIVLDKVTTANSCQLTLKGEVTMQSKMKQA